MSYQISFLKNCDPRLKILLAFFFAILVALSNNFKLLAIELLYCLILFSLSGIKPRTFLKKALWINSFLLLVVLTLPFTTQGTPLYKTVFFSVSKEGLKLAFLIFVKSNLIVFSSFFFLTTSSIFDIAHAFHHLKVPSKLVQILFFTVRYLHVIERDLKHLKEAAYLRAFVPRNNLFTYRTIAYLIGTLFVKSYDRSLRIYEAMLCRGFDGTFPVYQHFILSRRDIFLVLLSSIYFLFMAIFLL